MSAPIKFIKDSVSSAMTLLGKYKNVLTWIWVLLLAGFAIYSIFRDPDTLGRIATRLEWPISFISLFLIVIGKMLTIGLLHYSLRGYGEVRSFQFSWRAYSLADIAKYLPGGIWGIAGRLAIYKQAGITLTKGSRALLAETFLLIFLFGLTGAATLAVALGLSWLGIITITIVGIAGFTSLVLWLPKGGVMNRISAFLMTGLATLVFGLSFAVFASALINDILWSTGQFNLAFAVGQLAIFAPSGIGVREIVVNFLLPDSSNISFADIIEIAMAHRVVWLVADLLVLLPVMWMREPKTEG